MVVCPPGFNAQGMKDQYRMHCCGYRPLCWEIRFYYKKKYVFTSDGQEREREGVCHVLLCKQLIDI